MSDKKISVDVALYPSHISMYIGDANYDFTWEEQVESVRRWVEDSVAASTEDRVESVDTVKKLAARLRDTADMRAMASYEEQTSSVTWTQIGVTATTSGRVTYSVGDLDEMRENGTLSYTGG